MHVTVKNEKNAFQLQAKHTDSIAGIKALYAKSGKCQGRQDYIVLLHKGKELDDERTLGELGITDKAVLVHLSSTHEPYHGVDYDKLAKSVAARRHHQDENLRMMQQENLWAPDERGTVRSLGFDKSIVELPPHMTSPRMNTASTGGRTFFNQLSVRVNGATFHVLPRMEGRWNGEMITVPLREQGTQVCSSEILFREEDGVWSQRQMNTTIVGITSTHHFWLKPVGDGLLTVETDDPALRGCDLILQEIGANILLFRATSKRTGQTKCVETITIVDSSRRLRTIQQFDESGGIRMVLVMNEKRVVDAVSGAMERYDTNFATRPSYSV